MRTYIIDVEENTEQLLLGYLTILGKDKVKFTPLSKSVGDAKKSVFVNKPSGTILRRSLSIKPTPKAEEAKSKKLNPRTEKYPVYRYKNYSRKSGVYAYAISPDGTIIYVYFKGKKRGWYKYDVYSAPRFVIKNMVKRAKSGWGLNRYINKHPDTYFWKGTY